MAESTYKTGTANETWHIGHPSPEFLAADRKLYDELITAGEDPDEWFALQSPDDVIRVRGPRHLIDRALVPLRFSVVPQKDDA
jgi:hypothetical protein